MYFHLSCIEPASQNRPRSRPAATSSDH